MPVVRRVSVISAVSAVAAVTAIAPPVPTPTAAARRRRTEVRTVSRVRATAGVKANTGRDA